MPCLRKLRGATYLQRKLNQAALSSSVEPTSDGYRCTVHGVEMVMPDLDGFKGVLFPPDVIAGYTQHWDIQPGDTVFDCGAYRGDFLVYAAKRAGPSGHVIALEPDEANADYLEQVVAVNDVDNVDIMRKGVWNEPGTVSFDAGNGCESTVSASGEKTVDVTTLNRLAETYGRPDVIKMDIEGSELSAFEAADEALAGGDVRVACASYHYVDG